MVRRKLSIAERWQAIGIKNAVMINRQIAANFGLNNSVISRLVARHRQTGSIEERRRSGRPRKTTPREDLFLACQARLHPFSTAGQLRGMWPSGGPISDRTVIRRLYRSRLRARSPLKRPELTRRHCQA